MPQGVSNLAGPGHCPIQSATFVLAVTMNPVLLVAVTLDPPYLADLEKHFDVVYAPDPASRAATAARLPEVEVVLTNGMVGFTAEEIDSTPRLRLLSALGVGYENLDLAHAKARGIVVSNGSGTNDNIVADHAMALLLAAIRRIPLLDRATRNGIWRDGLPVDPGLSGKKFGIVGLGQIGQKIARRAQGFDCEIGYFSRRQREASPHTYFADIMSLATWADILVVATPGGPETRHLINADVLKALGPKGFLINIARGSVVDTEALAAALAAQHIAGAGLDVYESEPEPPRNLLGFEQLVLTPHVGGRSPEAVRATVDLFVANALRYFEGKDVTTPI